MLLLSSKPCIVGKLFSIGCCICHHFEEHQTIRHRHTLHAMPLAQAITTVVAQPRADACRLHCVEHFYSTTKSLTNVMAHMLHIALFKRSMSECYTGSNMLVCALSFDSQLSCVFLLIKCIPTSQMFSFFPFLLMASSIFPALLDDSHLKPTCQAAAHPLSTLQSLGNISNQPALQPQEPATWAFTPVDML